MARVPPYNVMLPDPKVLAGFVRSSVPGPNLTRAGVAVPVFVTEIRLEIVLVPAET